MAKRIIALIAVIVLTLLVIVVPISASNADVYIDPNDLEPYKTTFPLETITSWGIINQATQQFNIANTVNVDTIAIFGKEEFNDGTVQWNEQSWVYNANEGISSQVDWVNTLSAYSTDYQFVWKQDYINVNGNNGLGGLIGPFQRYDFGTFVWDNMYNYHQLPYIAFSYNTGNTISQTVKYEFDIIIPTLNNTFRKEHIVRESIAQISGEYWSQKLIDNYTMNAIVAQYGYERFIVENYTATFMTQGGINIDMLQYYNIVDPLAPSYIDVLKSYNFNNEVDGNTAWEILSGGVDSFFDIDLFGTISIGDIVRIILVLGVLFAVIKIFLGG